MKILVIYAKHFVIKNSYGLTCRWLDEGEDDGKIIRDLKIQGEFSTDQVEKARVSISSIQATFFTLNKILV